MAIGSEQLIKMGSKGQSLLIKLWKKAAVEYNRGNMDTALKFLDEALQIEPNNASVLSFIGRIKYPMTPEQKIAFIKTYQSALDSYKAGDYTQAIDSFNEVLAIQPSDAKTINLIKLAKSKLKERSGLGEMKIANALTQEETDEKENR